MNNNIICATSPTSLGCTFVDWSIQFLSNQSEYYSIEENQWIPLSHNPLIKINAHGHKRNLALGFENSCLYIAELRRKKFKGVMSLYSFPVHPQIAKKHLEIDIKNMSPGDQWKNIHQYQLQDYNQLLEYCGNSQDIKMIYVAPNPQSILYYRNSRSSDSRPSSFLQSAFISSEEIRQEEDSFFYSHSIQQWKNNKLNNIWDIRERLALCTRPFTSLSLKYNQLNFKNPHLWIDCHELWHSGEHAIKKIMNYADLPISVARFNNWIKVYKEWQKLHIDILEFSWQVDHIVDSIINNWHYNIDLTFDQEVIIQHCLIYKHGLNLKTWQLEKFPTNTKKLHQLLEPNIHSLESY